jgi:glycosyltransferase involved in cell wall biosynthesis
MEQNNFDKLLVSINNLKEKKSRLYFFVQDTKGNAKASVAYVYRMALALKNAGFNPIILHEQKDYTGVGEWLGSEYMEIIHNSIEGQQLQISPEDFIIVPEIFGYMMPQVSNLPCGKIVLCQSGDWVTETLSPGQSWSTLGFTKSIITSDWLKSYVAPIMKGVSYDVVEPVISDRFSVSKYPSKPIIAVHSREQRDGVNLIKKFYLKFPQFRWVTFRDMRSQTEEEFSNTLKECCLSVWMDTQSSFGTYPLESMASNCPVIGLVPDIKPDWMDENNGIWTKDADKMIDMIADYIQNWIEDNISEKLYEDGLNTSSKYNNLEKFNQNVVELFTSYSKFRMDTFSEQLNKFKTETEA